jgi:hypothetical protein
MRNSGRRPVRFLQAGRRLLEGIPVDQQSDRRAIHARQQLVIRQRPRNRFGARQHFALATGVQHVFVAPRHLQQHAPHETRVTLVLAIEQAHARVQQLDHRHRPAVGSDLFEHQAHELAGGLGARRLEPRLVPLARELLRLPGHDRAEGRGREKQTSSRRDGHAMTGGELLQAVRRRGWPGHDGLVRQVSAQVRGQLCDR